jgi:predicted permease
MNPPPRKSRFGGTGPWPSNIDRDVHDEIAAHLEERRAEYAAQGLSPGEAAAAAARKFGNRDDVADACRLIDRRYRDQERRSGMLTDLRQDLGYAVRLFSRSPGFAVIAILTLAIGIGATSTIFTLANWALLRPLPGVADPDRVGIVWVGRSADRGFYPSRLSYPNLADAVARLHTVSLGGYRSGMVSASTGGPSDEARNLLAQFVTASYFDVLGLRLQVGRPFTAAEDVPPSPFLGAVISDRLWTSMFDRDPAVLQRTMTLSGVRFTVLGVAPPGFHGTERLSSTDLWLPGTSGAIVNHQRTIRYDARNSSGFAELVARLRPGATWPQAQAELDSLRAWLRDEYPADNQNFKTNGFTVMGPVGPPPQERDRLPKLVRLMGAASALVLLIACANVAGLLTIKGVGRRNEIAVRKALGAGRWRLVRQQLAEGTLLWLCGGAAALLVVRLLRGAFDISKVVLVRGLDATPPIDWRVLSFTLVSSLVVGLIFSVLPALRATNAEAAETLRATTPAATRHGFAGASLAVFQLAASLTLLVGAFLLVGTVRHLTRVPLGFDPQGLVVFYVQPGSIGYSEPEALAYVEEFQRRLRQAVGVRDVATAMTVPFAGVSMGTRIRTLDGAGQGPISETPETSLFSPSYFATLRIPLLKGRLFAEADFAAARRGDARPVILSDGLARRLFGTADPLGREVEFPVIGRKGLRYQVVGVVGTVRYFSLTKDPETMVYEPEADRGALRTVTIVARGDTPAAIAQAARRIALELNPALPLVNIVSMPDAIARYRGEADTLARLLVLLAGVAALLACVGLYGVVAHGVAMRRREFGIRVALGASPAQVWRLVVRTTAAITAAGLLLGLGGGFAIAQVLRNRLIGVHPFDPALWSLAAGSLVLVAVLASLKPARAATRVNVNETLRAL